MSHSLFRRTNLSVFVALFTSFVLSTIAPRRAGAEPTTTTATTRAAPAPRDGFGFEEQNCRLALPPAWHRVTPRTHNEAVLLNAERSWPPATVVLSSTTVGVENQSTAEQLADETINNGKVGGFNPQLVKRAAMTINGIEGVRLECTVVHEAIEIYNIALAGRVRRAALLPRRQRAVAAARRAASAGDRRAAAVLRHRPRPTSCRAGTCRSAPSTG